MGGCDGGPGKINLTGAEIIITTGFEDPAEIIIKMNSATKGTVIRPMWPESKVKCTVKDGQINIYFKCRERLPNGGEALCYFSSNEDDRITGNSNQRCYQGVITGYLVEESPWRGRARLLSNKPITITFP